MTKQTAIYARQSVDKKESLSIEGQIDKCKSKLSDDEKNKAEKLVNSWIDAKLDVVVEEMSKEAAIKSGAEDLLPEYPDVEALLNTPE